MLALESLSPDLARWIAETTVVASAMALIAYLGSRFRAPSPATRHLLWVAVLIKLMTPSLVHWPWSIPLASHSPVRIDETSIGTGSPDLSQWSLEITDEPFRCLDDQALLEAILQPESGPPLYEPPVKSTLAATTRQALVNWLPPVWLIGSVGAGFGQLLRIVRFRRSVGRTNPAPAWLIEEAERIGGLLSVQASKIEVVDRLATPILWCLGRPVLLIPRSLLDSLERGRWRGILAHELAHLRRGDPWVVRLELLASIGWWWNPLFWLTRQRIDFEAELACDAWVARLLPCDRIAYAESLVRIATSFDPSRPAMPTLGIAGAGKTLERRLIMILREPTPRTLNSSGWLAAALLVALAAPSWTLADPTPATAVAPYPAEARSATPEPITLAVMDDDDDQEDSTPSKKAAQDAKRKAEDEAKSRDDAAPGRRGRPAGGAIDPELGRRMEALGEEIAKEMEKKFGADFERKMEAIGKDVEARFGPDFEKQMEKLGEELAKKFGPDSDFAKEMKSLGERMAKEAGPDLLKDQSGSAKAREKAKAAKVKAEAAKEKAEAAKDKAARAKVARSADGAKAKPDEKTKARRIEALQSRIESLKKELEILKDGNDDEDAADEG